MGPGYILDHCYEAYKQEQHENLYRAYIAEGVRMMSENTANFCGGQYLDKHWIDYANLAPVEKEEQRSGEEIVVERLGKFGITVIPPGD